MDENEPEGGWDNPQLKTPYENDTPLDADAFERETESAKLMYQGNRVALPNVNGLARRMLPSV